MLAHPDIDAVAVVLRVPAHYQITKDALNAGKHVFTEWPLGRTTGEAEELADLARAKGVRSVVGLQARAAPAVLQLKQLVEQGYVGEIMSCSMTLVRGGVLARPSGRTWQRDDELGANTLTIATGHSIDAMRFVVGDFAEVSAIVSTQCQQWYETDTDQYLDVTSPDNILINGRLTNGAVVSAHVASIPWAGSGYRLEVYGREGTLIADSEDSPQLGPVRLQGAQGGDELDELSISEQHRFVLEGMPQGAPYNVGQLYYYVRRGHPGPGWPPARFRYGGGTAPASGRPAPARRSRSRPWRWRVRRPSANLYSQSAAVRLELVEGQPFGKLRSWKGCGKAKPVHASTGSGRTGFAKRFANAPYNQGLRATRRI